LQILILLICLLLHLSQVVLIVQTHVCPSGAEHLPVFHLSIKLYVGVVLTVSSSWLVKVHDQLMGLRGNNRDVTAIELAAHRVDHKRFDLHGRHLRTILVNHRYCPASISYCSESTSGEWPWRLVRLHHCLVFLFCVDCAHLGSVGWTGEKRSLTCCGLDASGLAFTVAEKVFIHILKVT
jgi:hypothetical protein